jgi:hypothetical protein
MASNTNTRNMSSSGYDTTGRKRRRMDDDSESKVAPYERESKDDVEEVMGNVSEYVDCIVRKNGAYDLQAAIISEGQIVPLRMFKESEDGTMKRVWEDKDFSAILSKKGVQIQKLDRSKGYVTVDNVYKTIGDYLMEFLQKESSDFAMFGGNFTGYVETCEIKSEEKNAEDIDMVDVAAKGRGGGAGTSGGGAGTSGGGRGAIPVSRNDIFSTSTVHSFKGRTIIVKGHMQSGKTAFMLTGAAHHLASGLSVVICLRNSNKDKHQIIARLNSFVERMNASFPERFKNQFKIVVLGETPSETEMLAGPTLYVSIGNGTPLKKYADIIDANDVLKGKFTMFIDEVDLVDSLDTNVQNELNRLRIHAFSTFNVSATVIGPLLAREVSEGNVYVMQRPEFHKGIENYTQVLPPVPEESDFTTTKSGDVLENSPHFGEYLREMSTRKLPDGHWMGGCGQFHPIISLARVAKCLNPNFRVLAHMKKNYPQIPSMFFCAEGLFVSINGFGPRGISLRHNDGTTDVGEKVPSSEDREGILVGDFLYFKNSSPSDMLTWLHQNGGVEKYPRIFICAGDLASRGVSFGASNFDEYKGKGWWHLTEMYALVAKSTDQPELLQLFGRLSGLYQDNVPLRVITTQSAFDDLYKAYTLQEELITRARETLSKSISGMLDDDEAPKTMGKAILELPISKTKVPSSKRPIMKKNKVRLNTVKGDDGGWSMDEYKSRMAPIFLGVKAKVAEKEKAKEGQVPVTMDLVEFQRLTKKMFPKWAKTESKIANFMKHLEPTKIYTETEIRELCAETGIRLLKQLLTAPNSESTKTHSAGFGCIIKKVDNTYQLYPELVAKFVEHF